MAKSSSYSKAANAVVRIDHMHLLLRRLFRSVPKHEMGKRMHFIENYGHLEIEVRGFCQLSVFDFKIFQAILLLSCQKRRGTVVKEQAISEKYHLLRMNLKLKDESTKDISCAIETSAYELANVLNKQRHGKWQRMVLNSLKNMTGVAFHIKDTNSRKTYGFNVLSYSNEDNGRIQILINPFLALAILGKRNYTKIDINESRQLESEPACLLHSYLCAVINLGKTRSFLLTTLMNYVWDEDESPAVVRKRLSRLVKDVLPCFERINWNVRIENDVVFIGRPERSDGPTQGQIEGG